MRALNNQVVIAPREDLEDNWGNIVRVNKITGLIEPRPVYGEIVDVGPGDQLHPDIPALRKGDLVVWDLSKIGPPVVEHGKTLFLNSFNCLLGKLYSPKMVLTERAPLAMQAAITTGAIILPDSVMADGIKEAGKESPVTCVYERVVSTGNGITFAGRSRCARCQCELQRTEAPLCKPGDLVVFNPLHSVEWRRRGKWLRFTPASEVRGIVEE
jgi:hypothetical protein